MSLIERISDSFSKILPSMSPKSRPTMQAGIGSGHGMVGFQDDMIVSKPTIIFHASQIFFNFLAMACYASVASFQAKWKVGPSGLTGFAIFTSVAGMLLSAFMLAVPVIYEKHDKLVRLARALKEVRVSFILTGTGTAFSLLIAFIVTISAWTQPGCKNPDNDPHGEALGDDFKNALPGWCNTKKAAAIFFWLAFASWAASVVVLILDWRNGRLNAPRDPPFTAPTMTHDEEEGEEEEEGYTSIPPPRQNSVPSYANAGIPANPFADSNRYSTPSVSTAPTSAYTPASAPQPLAAGRPSMDAYGAFSDPAPSGFGASAASGYSPAPTGYTGTSTYATPPQTVATPPSLPEPDFGPRMSRTMQYADPYSAVRASIGTPQAPNPTPPSYESYQGYR